MLEDLLDQPIGQGDIFSNANTIILMGRTRHEGRMGRALAITKHRGSAHGEEIRPYRITERVWFSIESRRRAQPMPSGMGTVGRACAKSSPGRDGVHPAESA